MQTGRRKMLFIGTAITLGGNSLMCSGKFPVHLIGVTIYAAGQGLSGPALYRYIEEYVPLKYLSASFAGITVLGSIAHLLSELSVLILPNDSDTEALKENNTWIICEGMPSVFCFLTCLGLLTLTRLDSAKFYLYSKDDGTLAKKAIH